MDKTGKPQSIDNSKICLDCDGVFQAGRGPDCPYCGSSATTWLAPWVRPMDGGVIKRAATGDRPYGRDEVAAGAVQS